MNFEKFLRTPFFIEHLRTSASIKRKNILILVRIQKGLFRNVNVQKRPPEVFYEK